ncbi:hypothetical protein OROGR_006898 [Orobanche gracilis]
MGDCTATPSVMEMEEDLFASVQQIMEALELKNNLTDDAKKLLANLGSQLIDMSGLDGGRDEDSEENDGLIEIEHRLDEIQNKVMNWEDDQSMIWDYGPEEAHEYLKAVEEARKLTEILENKSTKTNSSTSDSDLLMRAHDILEKAMSRLEEEFRHLLVQNRLSFKPDRMSFRSTEDDTLDANSVISSGDDSIEDVVHRDSTGRASEDYTVELIHQNVISDLKNIANVMFDSNYGSECSRVFVGVQRDALDDCLSILEVEKLSIEDVLKMEWSTLNSKIGWWMRAAKLFVRFYLASEKLLTDQIFADLGPAGPACFVESSKPAVMQILSFCMAITIGPHQPEKLIRILDMYEVLDDLAPDIASLYSDGAGSSVGAECRDILKRLGDCARATFLEFENAVRCNVSVNPFAGGGVHPLTRYVMNYVKTLTDYSKTLDEVLKDQDSEDCVSTRPESSSPLSEDESTSGGPSSSPMAKNIQSLISILEINLDGKSSLYKDESLQHFFLMNNVHYMAEKVKHSGMRMVLGDEWIRKHNWKFQQHAMTYERATWSSILGLLKDEGIQNPGSNSISKSILKERLRSFYLRFEEVYRSQTGWSIRDGQLRDDVRISMSLKVIQAYRAFVGRHVNHINEKHIKYTADDLEDRLLDLFEGSPKSLHGGGYKR